MAAGTIIIHVCTVEDHKIINIKPNSDPATPVHIHLDLSCCSYSDSRFLMRNVRAHLAINNYTLFKHPTWMIAPECHPTITEDWLNDQWEKSLVFDHPSPTPVINSIPLTRFNGVQTKTEFDSKKDEIGDYLSELEAWLSIVHPKTLDDDLREHLAMYCMIDESMGGRVGHLAARFATPTTDKDVAIARMLVGGSANYTGSEPVATIQTFKRIISSIVKQ